MYYTKAPSPGHPSEPKSSPCSMSQAWHKSASNQWLWVGTQWSLASSVSFLITPVRRFYNHCSQVTLLRKVYPPFKTSCCLGKDPALWMKVHLISDAKSWFIGKDPDARKDWRQKEKGQQRMRWLDSITNSMDMNLSKLHSGGQRNLACCSPWGRSIGHNLVTEQQPLITHK